MIVTSNFTQPIRDFIVDPYVEIGLAKENCTSKEGEWETLFAVSWGGIKEEEDCADDEKDCSENAYTDPVVQNMFIDTTGDSSVSTGGVICAKRGGKSQYNATKTATDGKCPQGTVSCSSITTG